jgi:hypothetical protein
LSPHEVQRVPLVFAGDPFQTLNPTGFRWESTKAQAVEEFVFMLDPSKSTGLSDLNHQQLTYNFRSTVPITKFCNVIHGLRALLFGLHNMRPQTPWREASNDSRDVVVYDSTDACAVPAI